MANAFANLGAIRLETLAAEIFQSQLLFVRVCADHNPAAGLAIAKHPASSVTLEGKKRYNRSAAALDLATRKSTASSLEAVGKPSMISSSAHDTEQARLHCVQVMNNRGAWPASQHYSHRFDRRRNEKW
jgi:hypothetical protein